MRRGEITLLISMIIGGLLYSIMSWAWISSSFVTKDYIKLIFDRMDRIEIKLDHLIER